MLRSAALSLNSCRIPFHLSRAASNDVLLALLAEDVGLDQVGGLEVLPAAVHGLEDDGRVVLVLDLDEHHREPEHPVAQVEQSRELVGTSARDVNQPADPGAEEGEGLLERLLLGAGRDHRLDGPGSDWIAPAGTGRRSPPRGRTGPGW